jgi:high-affinity iron transporter
MAAAFVLFLREGLEASLIVSLLLAALRQLGNTRATASVWIGVGLAGLFSLIGGVVLYLTIRDYAGSTFQTIFETITYLVAVVLLTSMTFWMQRHSRGLKREIAAKAGTAGSGFALGLLAFTMVGREGLETAVFTLAFAFQTRGMLLITGGVLGMLAAVGLCFLIYRLGYRLDFRVFFRVMGILLLFFAAGLLGDAVQNLQSLGWLPIGTTPLWSTAHILSEETQIGDLLHSLIGYSEAPTALQSLAYGVFIVVAGALFWNATRKPDAARTTAQPEPIRGAQTKA